jgi:hypothetical protein
MIPTASHRYARSGRSVLLSDRALSRVVCVPDGHALALEKIDAAAGTAVQRQGFAIGRNGNIQDFPQKNPACPRFSPDSRQRGQPILRPGAGLAIFKTA